MSFTKTPQTLLVLLLCFHSSLESPAGVPGVACMDMTPRHDGNQPQSGSPAIRILTPSKIISGRTISVVIESTSGDFAFRGFFLQARTPTGEIIGSFEVGSKNGLQNCGGITASAATHNSRDPKTSVVVQWRVPDTSEATSFNFVVTIVESFTVFWINQASEMLTITPDTGIDDVFEGCGVTKTCYGIPDLCYRQGNCAAFTAVTFDNITESFQFELLSTTGQGYIAMGLSHTRSMKDASVIECVQLGTGIVGAYTSWTTIDNSKRNLVSQDLIDLSHGALIDGRIYCEVDRVPVSVVNGVSFNLLTTPFYLLLASGTGVTPTAVLIHDTNHGVSDETVLLTIPTEVTGGIPVHPLLLTHGSLMIVAWIGLTSVGIVLARYFKRTWNEKSCGQDVWFVWHIICMFLTWALTLAGFIIIFVDMGVWVTSPHSVTGCIVLALSFLQPFGAIFRPDPKAPSRPLFNWFHHSFGHITHLLAVLTIFFAVSLPRARLPEYTYFVLASFVAFYLFMHIVFNSVLICGEMKQQQRVGVATSKDSPYKMFLKTLFALFVIVITLFVIALVLIFTIDING